MRANYKVDPTYPSLAYQRKNIKMLQSKLGIDDDTYRAVLHGFSTSEGKPVSSSKQLTALQAEQLIAQWKDNCDKQGLAVNLYYKDARKTASKNQVDMLRYWAIRCGIRYAPLHAETYYKDGKLMTGNELRDYLYNMWRAKAALPVGLLRHIFSSWINPQTNSFLMDAGYRNWKKVGFMNMEVCFMEQLNSDEVQYCIKRFRAIADKIAQGEQPVYPNESLN